MEPEKQLFLRWSVLGIVFSLGPGFSRAESPVSSSANFSLLSAPTVGGGGSATGSTVSATVSVSDGMEGGVSQVATNGAQAKSGFTGQLYDVAGFAIKEETTPVDEDGPARQLEGQIVLDDETRLLDENQEKLTWSGEADDLEFTLTPEGLVSVQSAYEDTTIDVRATHQDFQGIASYLLPVRNVGIDDYPGYDGDGLDDGWQVTWFGLPPNSDAAPGLDIDLDGRDNAFEELTGTSPLDASDFFRYQIDGVVAGVATLRLNKVMPDRIYTLHTGTDLETFSPEGTPFTFEIEESDKTIQDTNASGGRKFYQMEVTRRE